METEIAHLKHGKIDVSKFENIIYFKVFGDLADDDTSVLTRLSEAFFDEINGPTIRIWDLTDMTADQYRLTPKGIDTLEKWADIAKKRWPGNVAYVIGKTDLIFGMSRMYEIKASDNLMSINAVKSFDDLPVEIKIRIWGKIPAK